MLYKDILILGKIEVYTDELHQQKKREVKREVFCDKKSVSQFEFHHASQSGISPQFVFIVRIADYEGEEIAYYNNNKYAIYRSYEKGEFIELYATKKVGA